MTAEPLTTAEILAAIDAFAERYDLCPFGEDDETTPVFPFAAALREILFTWETQGRPHPAETEGKR